MIGTLSPAVIEKLGLPPDTEIAPETDLEALGVTQAQMLQLLDEGFPMLLGMEGKTPAQRVDTFAYGLTSPDLSAMVLLDQQSGERVNFGRVGTVQRLSALIEFCSQKAYPDNGGD